MESNERYPIRENGKWGYIDRKGEIVIEPQFLRIAEQNYHYNLEWTEGLAPVQFNNGLWGYIDKTGKAVIKPQFTTAARFSDGLAAVVFENSDLVAYIDRSGKVVIPPKYCYRGEFSNFREGRAYAELTDKNCFVLTITHQKVTVDRRIDYGYIDKTGKMVISKIGSSGFSEGLARIWIKDKYGFIDNRGKIVIKPRYESAHNFVEGLAYVQIDDKSFYIDKTGKTVIKAPKDYYLVCCHDFTEGFAKIITRKNKYGYIDKQGKVIIKAQFDGAEEFAEGLAAVNLGADKTYSGGKWGYIDRTGKVVIDFQFIAAEPFRGGLALVGNIYKGLGYIDKTGKYIWKPTR